MNNIDDVLIALRRIIRSTDLHSKYLAKTTGLTAPQLLLLQALNNATEQSTASNLAKIMSLSQATITIIVDRLENKGLLHRQRSDEDRRKVHIILTPKALELIKEAPTPLQEQFSTEFNKLQEWEQNMIISSIQRVAYMMDAKDIEASPVLDLGVIEAPIPPDPPKV